jgi:diphthine synthase
MWPAGVYAVIGMSATVCEAPPLLHPLQLYNFGETVSLVMWTSSWQPDSYVDKIEKNLQHGLHTLCLLDIKMKEQSEENLMKGRKIYEPPRFMTAPQAAEQLLTVIARRKEAGQPFSILSPTTRCVGVARIGSDNEGIVHSTLQEMVGVSMGPPLHSLIIVGPTHPMEDEILHIFSRKH